MVVKIWRVSMDLNAHARNTSTDEIEKDARRLKARLRL